MGRRAFTLMEIIAVIVIVGVLATLGLPMFQNIIESSKTNVCETNVQTLQKAVDIYVIEHDSVPGSLAELAPQHIEKAYAQVMREKGAWKKRLAYFIVDLSKGGFGYAYAQKAGPKLVCPNNPNPAGTSYGLSDAVVGMTALRYKNLKDTRPNLLLVGDADNPHVDFTNGSIISGLLKDRPHKKYHFVSTTKFLIGASIGGTTGIFSDGCSDFCTINSCSSYHCH